MKIVAEGDLEKLILKGMKRALKKLLAERIKNDDYLIIANEKGDGIRIKAREYAKTLK